MRNIVDWLATHPEIGAVYHYRHRYYPGRTAKVLTRLEDPNNADYLIYTIHTVMTDGTELIKDFHVSRRVYDVAAA